MFEETGDVGPHSHRSGPLHLFAEYDARNRQHTAPRTFTSASPNNLHGCQLVVYTTVTLRVTPLRLIIRGTGGMGKSYLIQAILWRLLLQTGVASFLHSLLYLPTRGCCLGILVNCHQWWIYPSIPTTDTRTELSDQGRTAYIQFDRAFTLTKWCDKLVMTHSNCNSDTFFSTWEMHK